MPELFNCRFLIAFTQKVAIRRSLLQREGWDLEIPPTGKLNDSVLYAEFREDV